MHQWCCFTSAAVGSKASRSASPLTGGGMVLRTYSPARGANQMRTLRPAPAWRDFANCTLNQCGAIYKVTIMNLPSRLDGQPA
jgi:hypothetical protein